MVGGWMQWPFEGGPAKATYGQIVLMSKATKREDDTPKPLPKRVWQDFLKHRKRNGPS